jgi:thiol-disulfide isomerase/thioredoxin
MKNLLFSIIFCISIHQVQAQKTINVSGQIENSNSAELIYLGFDGDLTRLNLSSSGAFSVDASIQQNPSFFYFANISKQGKIQQKTPLIWFEKDSLKIILDWSNKSFQMQGLMSFQPTSEKMEALSEKEQIDFALNNPNSIPGLYFVNKNKEKISIPDLEKISQEVNNEFKNSIDLKRIEYYVTAKKRKTLIKGNTVEDFKLPDKDGELVSVINTSNKKKLIGFFSSGCSYSIASISLLEQLANLNNNKIEMITIWDDQTKDTWLNDNQEKKSKITWTNLWDEYGFATTYLNRTMWPIFYVINEDGELNDVIKGYSKNTAEKLKKLVE